MKGEWGETGRRYFTQAVVKRCTAFIGALVALVLLLYPRYDHAPFRIFVPGWTPLHIECRGHTLPVEDEAAKDLIRRFISSLRYDDLLDLYPSMGAGADRKPFLGQEDYGIYIVAGDDNAAIAVALIQAERPQAKAWKVEAGGRILWQDFYRSGDDGLLQEMLDLQARVEREGLGAVAPPPVAP